MNPAATRPRPVLARRVGMVLAWLVLLLGSGCAWLPAPPEPASLAPALQACSDWYARLDAAIDRAGVRDAGATRLAGFAHLRVDRFTASWRDALRADPAAPDAGRRRAGLLQRLLQLDLEARRFEIANLPAPVRAQLVAGSALRPDAAALLQHTRDCAADLGAFELATPARLATLQTRLQVPDDYVTAYRVAGLYPLTRLAFARGIRHFEAERRAVFARDELPAPGITRLRLSPPADPSVAPLSAPQLRALLAPAPLDPWQLPAPSPQAQERLLAHFAPSFDLDIAGDDDRPGALLWRPGAAPDQPETLAVDSRTPVLYRHAAYTRYGAHTLLQLVYTLWFAARSASGHPDLLAGQLDGLVFRVTLAPDGTPLVYDSIHPCGCYHLFFPTPAAQPRPAPESGIEWAFSPQTLPAIGLQDRLVVRIAAGNHYIKRISVDPQPGAAFYAWRDDNSLRALPTSAGASRSVFGPDGFIEGTDRAEAWLFWPMGIRRAGAMRQWGRHATAFVGRRHFDDADLLQQRFIFDPAHFGP